MFYYSNEVYMSENNTLNNLGINNVVNDNNDIEQEIIKVAEIILLKYEKAFLELAK